MPAAAAEYGTERFMLISTDKAVNPTHVMGTTKRAAEMVVSQMAPEQAHMRFIAVHVGNVLGSRGSVILKFKEQIEPGAPVLWRHRLGGNHTFPASQQRRRQAQVRKGILVQ